jgi:hypothetical protein
MLHEPLQVCKVEIAMLCRVSLRAHRIPLFQVSMAASAGVQDVITAATISSEAGDVESISHATARPAIEEYFDDSYTEHDAL